MTEVLLHFLQAGFGTLALFMLLLGRNTWATIAVVLIGVSLVFVRAAYTRNP